MYELPASESPSNNSCSDTRENHDGSNSSDEDSMGSVTRTGKYIFCLYSFRYDFIAKLYVFIRSHGMAMLRGVVCVYCEEVPQIKEQSSKKLIG